MYKIYKLWWRMAGNSNRFIPQQWLEAVGADSGSYNRGNRFTNHRNLHPGWSVARQSYSVDYDTVIQSTNASTVQNYRNLHQATSTSRQSKTRIRPHRAEDSQSHKLDYCWRNSFTNNFSSCQSNHQRFLNQQIRHHPWKRDNANKIFPINKQLKKEKTNVSHSSAAPIDSECTTTESEDTRSEIDWTDSSRFELEREWEDVEPPSCLSQDAVVNKKKIRVVSYNILSQKLLHLNSGLYRNCDSTILHWEYRWPKIKSELEEFDADIVCLQEVEKHHFLKEILNFLESLGYDCIYKKRTGNNVNKPDGVLIAYKKEKYRLVTESKVEYFRGTFSPVNQDNVGIITILKPFSSNSETSEDDSSCICIVNTHLLYNPKRGDIKLVQLSTLFAEVHKVITSHSMKKIPIIMCGDFNSVADSHLFDFITKQQINYEGLLSKHVSGQKVGHKGRDVPLPSPLLPECLNITDHGCMHRPEDHSRNSTNPDNIPIPYLLRHSLGNLKSSYTHDEPRASTTQDRGVTVDYIFYSPHFCTEIQGSSNTSSPRNSSIYLYPSRRLNLIHPRELKRVRSIPNAAHPSDHLPIVVDFVMVQS